MNHIDSIWRNLVSVKRYAFVFKQFPFLFNKFAIAVTCKTTQASVGGDDTMARHFRRERITPQRLPYCLRRLASDSFRELAVCYDFAARNETSRVIDFLLESGDNNGVVAFSRFWYFDNLMFHIIISSPSQSGTREFSSPCRILFRQALSRLNILRFCRDIVSP